jgi:acetylornithine deacetylase/succinyl-diaminopimelate desuccinylase-like protein
MTRDLLTRLIKIDTTNPPGSELPAAEALASFLAQEGVEAEVIPSASGRGSVFARIHAAHPTGRPLLLLSHLDVAGADAEAWPEATPPFGGASRDGALWGRGTLFGKSVAAIDAVLLTLLRPLAGSATRDVIFLATADAEQGGAQGMAALLEKRPEILSAELALGEGGATVRDFFGDGRVVHWISHGEKGFVELELSAEGVGTRAAAPAGSPSAADRLARAIRRIEEARPRPKLVPPVADMLAALGSGAPFPRSTVLKSTQLSEIFELEGLAKRPSTRPLVTDQVEVTRIRAGGRDDSVPDRAYATLSCHLLPGTSVPEMRERIRETVQDERVHVTIRSGEVATSSPIEPRALDVIGRYAVLPGGEPQVIMPGIAVGPTDARYLRRQGIPTYGFVPFVLTADDLITIHGRGERVSLDNLDRGLLVMFEIVGELAGHSTR